MPEARTLIIWDRIGDYHRARVRAYEKLVGENSVITADLGASDKLYGWDTTGESGRHFLLSRKPVDQRDIVNRARAFQQILKEHRITRVAIAGYAHPEYFLFLILGRLAGCRIVMFGESWYGTGKLKNFLKGLFLRTFVHKFLLSGKRAREHFEERLGIPAERILEKYSVVDNQHFMQDGTRAREAILLCVARFSPEKNLACLIGAFQESKLADVYKLRIIGGGPEKENLLRQVDTRGQIELVEWVQYAALPAEYERARFFILPSTFEPWGLVVNEAMAAGLPVIVSDACGCGPDLVTKRNGFVFAAGKRQELVRLLDRVAEMDEGEWTQMSNASLEIISGYSCADWAEQLRKGFL